VKRHAHPTTFAVLAAFACLLPSTLMSQIGRSRETLWHIVHDVCVPDQRDRQSPAPCVQVNIDSGVAKGFAILKDIRGTTQFLLLATDSVTGIESPLILAPDAPNYFAEAWNARAYIDAALHKALPRDDIGLAINSAHGRSQDQLHIHIDCVQPDVIDALRAHESTIGNRWGALDVPIAGHHYLAIWVPGEQLGANNPFRILAAGLPGARQDMGDRTLVVVGLTRVDGTKGFALLEDQVDVAMQDAAHGEDLLDHSCRVAAAASP
jgi:CDP-diacylglycerol pyrophosphatase